MAHRSNVNARKQLIAYYAETKRIDDSCIGSSWLYVDYPEYPEDARGLICGAKTRAGTPCKRRDIQSNTRCKLHGGMSTGPKTLEGKKRSSMNGFIAKKKRSL